MILFTVFAKLHPRRSDSSHGLMPVLFPLPTCPSAGSSLQRFSDSQSLSPIFRIHFQVPCLASRKSFICHSYENCRGGYQQFPFRTSHGWPEKTLSIPFIFILLRTLRRNDYRVSALHSITYALILPRRRVYAYPI